MSGSECVCAIASTSIRRRYAPISPLESTCEASCRSRIACRCLRYSTASLLTFASSRWWVHWNHSWDTSATIPLRSGNHSVKDSMSRAMSHTVQRYSNVPLRTTRLHGWISTFARDTPRSASKPECCCNTLVTHHLKQDAICSSALCCSTYAALPRLGCHTHTRSTEPYRNVQGQPTGSPPLQDRRCMRSAPHEEVLYR